MGQEGERGEYGLCNAVLVSKPQSRFAVRWIALFNEVFDARIWSMHSVKYPMFAAALWPSDITVSLIVFMSVCSCLLHSRSKQVLGGSSFFRPLWNELQYLFEGHGELWKDNFGVHLWESIAWERYLKKLTVRYVNETRRCGGHASILKRAARARADNTPAATSMTWSGTCCPFVAKCSKGRFEGSSKPRNVCRSLVYLACTEAEWAKP